MRILNVCSTLVAVVAVGMLAGCAHTAKSPDVSTGIRKALDQAGLKSVSVAEDQDRGVVTLGGQVASEGGKSQADSIASAMANGQVVSDQIEVIPKNNASGAKTINADLDKGIAENLDAALIQNGLHNEVRFEVKSQVVTLRGDVDSEAMRQNAQQIASAVPNVQQVVNELQLKNIKATSSTSSE
ncbi:MAG TPA: BON domain-containing protein [Bryobacteraceae bacterium]|nr:BON domain-containing protein [Bryobacteraceae bacterium]